MLTVHRTLGTYRDKVARYIALTEFSRRKFIEGGLPAGRLVVKPNFAEASAQAGAETRSGFLFVGRLSGEKGVEVLAQAAHAAPNLRIRVAGDGPNRDALVGLTGVELLGSLDAAAVQGEMSRARALVLPSICYENFPRTLVEAFAAGLPVIASDIGAMAELVESGVTGLLFAAGDALDLAVKLQWAQEHPEEMAEMGVRARTRHETEYSAERNYEQLVDIYASAIEELR
jgi:glycosyltransferase involved in cell wall biosynthesis